MLILIVVAVVLVGVIFIWKVGLPVFFWGLAFFSDLFHLGITKPVVEEISHQLPDSQEKIKVEALVFSPEIGDRADKFFKAEFSRQ